VEREVVFSGDWLVCCAGEEMVEGMCNGFDAGLTDWIGDRSVLITGG
jgi:hypothetical protein